MTELPRITGKGKRATLLVDGRPFYMRAGEIHNSSASSLEYMEEHVWSAVRGCHLNTLLVPVYWECLESEEGIFDFTLVDGLLDQARREGVRLELLWFGLWKNGESSYVPNWVKEDRERFRYIRTANGGFPLRYGKPTFTVSPVCGEAVKADARAFAALMAHLRDTDPDHTVIAVQVENEVGLLGAVRDCSPEGEALFRSPVPDAIASLTVKNGTWQEVYGDSADESFMAWHYACAVERIASAGKAELALPMGVNAWLEQEPWTPGEAYPSGGPMAKNFPIWNAAAPSIGFYSPDIYVPTFRDVLREYAQGGRPILIPETRTEAAFYLYALGRHGALCFSPFGIEDAAGNPETDAQTMALLKIPPEILTAVRRNSRELFSAYRLIESMDELITVARMDDRLHGFLWDSASGTARETVELTDLYMDVVYKHTEPDRPIGGGLVVELSGGELIIVGINCALDFRSRDGRALDILVKEEGRYIDGRWVRGRILNGDERYYHGFRDQVSALRIKLLAVD